MGGRHKDRHRLQFFVCDATLVALRAKLPEQQGNGRKARFLVEAMAEALVGIEVRFRLIPRETQAEEKTNLLEFRLADETYLAIARYAKEASLDVSQQAANLLVVGLELIKKSGIAGPLGKEELRRLLRGALVRRTRLDSVRLGLSLIWRALFRR